MIGGGQLIGRLKQNKRISTLVMSKKILDNLQHQFNLSSKRNNSLVNIYY